MLLRYFTLPLLLALALMLGAADSVSAHNELQSSVPSEGDVLSISQWPPEKQRHAALPDVAFTRTAPLEGGPFITPAGALDSMAREPRARTPEN